MLAMLAIVAAMAWPALRKPFVRQRLRSAADEVRALLCEARNEAMRSGRTCTFRYQPGGDRFRAELQDASSPWVDVESDYLIDEEGGYWASIDDAAPEAEEKSLPEGVKFLADSSGVDEMPNAASAESPTYDNTSADWSPPVYFYPDGTASDARFLLASEGSCAVRILLRGVTGTVTVADAASSAE